MTEEVATDEVTAIVLYSTVRAVKLLIIDAYGQKELWVPKSVIVNDFQEYNFEEEQRFEITKWYAEKYNLGDGM